MARPCSALAQLLAPTRKVTSVWRLVHRVADPIGQEILEDQVLGEGTVVGKQASRRRGRTPPILTAETPA